MLQDSRKKANAALPQVRRLPDSGIEGFAHPKKDIGVRGGPDQQPRPHGP